VKRLVLILLVGCHNQPAPAPVTALQVTDELVDAGCLAPQYGLVDAVAAEYATGHDSWMACLFEGGTISSCNAPCAK